MGTGDTIPGKIDVQRKETNGDTERVAGPFNSGAVDYANGSLSESEKIFINTQNSDMISAPLQAREQAHPDARFVENEEILVRFKANATVGNDIDHDFDAWSISIIRESNRGKKDPDSLTVADQELSGDVTESDDDYTTFFKVTVPDGEEWRIVGAFEASAVEN